MELTQGAPVAAVSCSGSAHRELGHPSRSGPRPVHRLLPGIRRTGASRAMAPFQSLHASKYVVRSCPSVDKLPLETRNRVLASASDTLVQAIQTRSCLPRELPRVQACGARGWSVTTTNFSMATQETGCLLRTRGYCIRTRVQSLGKVLKHQFGQGTKCLPF